MQLNIEELENMDESVFGFNPESFKSSFDDIPENNIKIKVNKREVQFEEPIKPIKPINQTIPKKYAKQIRPKVQNTTPNISYEDIMSKMGMFVSDGKLHFMDKGVQQQTQHQSQLKQTQYQSQLKQTQYQSQLKQTQYQPQNSNIPQNSYIYNKYFKEELKPQNEIRRPMTAQEYKRKVLENYIQSQRIREMKSRKLLMPTTNINISSGNSGNLNKLFNFSKR